MCVATASRAETGVTAGQFFIERPTLQNLGFEWRIEGDPNRNASVQVAYRKKGAKSWTAGLPLLRLQGEDVNSSGCFAIGARPGFPPPPAPKGSVPRDVCWKGAYTYFAPNMFAGSIFDLQPDTEYEARFTLVDPDGVKGSAVRTVTVRTRAIPKPAADGRVLHVYPFGYTGPRQEPSFTGLLQAYYLDSNGGDWFEAFPPRVQPGDVILVHAGVYKDDRFRYGHELMSGYTQCCNTTGDGTYYLTAKGTPEKPIVIKAAGDGEVVFDGDGNYNLFNVQAADFNYFEGLTIRNTDIAFEAGLKGIAGSSGLTVKQSKIENVYVGIHTSWAGSKDYYIADNYFTGRNNPTELWGWTGALARLPGAEQNTRLLSQFAIKVYGSGHVVEYNKVRNFHDGIDHATYGDPPGYPKVGADGMPSSNDFIGNDISNVHDNCMELDGAAQNIRAIGNLCTNSAGEAFSLQPLMGGPAYFIRNIVYNSPGGGIKFDQYPAGGVFYNNTWFTNFAPGGAAAGPGLARAERSVSSNMHLRNNLFLRQDPATPVLGMITRTNYSSSDHNGFYLGDSSKAFSWNSPDFSVVAKPRAQLIWRSFDSLHDYQLATKQDLHSIAVDFDDFVNVKPIDPKASVHTLYDAATLDVRLKDGAPEIDKGVAIPNITDGYSGKAPDLGAIEFGKPSPHYGPRF
jgi:hypothetical protein